MALMCVSAHVTYSTHTVRYRPRHEADTLQNDRGAVLSALPVHTAATNSTLKHQRTPHQITVVRELHYKAEQKVRVRSLHEFGTSMLLTVAF